MKRYLYLVLLSVVFSTGRAQMLDDGTANVVNYWAVGDSAVYEMHTMDYKVVEGDTTVTKDLVERFSLQLTDTLPNGDMIFEYSELQSPDSATACGWHCSTKKPLSSRRQSTVTRSSTSPSTSHFQTGASERCSDRS